MDQEQNYQQNLIITPVIKSALLETAKWTKFLAILGFIAVGILVLIGIFYGTIISFIGSTSTFSQASSLGSFAFGGFFTIIYILIALLYFFPAKYLYNFSVKLKNAIHSSNQSMLSDAFFNLKSHYKYIGILMIILLAFYAVIFIFMLIAGIFAITQ